VPLKYVSRSKASFRLALLRLLSSKLVFVRFAAVRLALARLALHYLFCRSQLNQPINNLTQPPVQIVLNNTFRH
jgi:hypothetical protein